MSSVRSGRKSAVACRPSKSNNQTRKGLPGRNAAGCLATANAENRKIKSSKEWWRKKLKTRSWSVTSESCARFEYYFKVRFGCRIHARRIDAPRRRCVVAGHVHS